MTIREIIHAHLLTVGRDTAANLARRCRCTVRDIIQALDPDSRFARIAGQGTWDWTLDPIALAQLKGPAQDRQTPRPRVDFRVTRRTPQPIAPPPPLKQAWQRPPELVRGHRGHGWQGKDGSPTIIVAIRVLGPCTARQVADWAGITPAAVYHQCKVYADRLDRSCGDLRLKESP